MGGLCKKMIALDMMSGGVKLNIEEGQGRKNICGLMTTILYLSAIAAAATFSLTRYFENNVPIVSSSQHARTGNTSVDLLENQLLPIFLVLDSLSFIHSSRIPQFFDPGFMIIDGLKGWSDGYHLVPCSQLNATQRNAFKYFWSYSEYFEAAFNNSAYCPKPTGKLELKSVVVNNSRYNDYMKFYVAPCKSIPGGPNWASPTELQRKTYRIYTPSSNLDVNDRHIPERRYFRAVATRGAIPGLFQSNNFQLQETKVIDYSDTFTSIPRWRTKTSFCNIVADEVALAIRENDIANSNVVCYRNRTGCDFYHVNTYTLSDFEVILTRKYTTFLDVFAMIGGIQGLVFSVLLLLYTTYDKKQQIKYIANKVYPPSAFSDDIESKMKGNSEADSLSEIHVRNTKKRRCLPSCYRKDKSIAQMLEEKSVEKTRKGMDVISILKELSMLRVLIAALLTRQQARLTPWVDLSLQSNEKQPEVAGEDPSTSVNKNDMMSLGNMLTAARRMTTIGKGTQEDLGRFSVTENDKPQEQLEGRTAGGTLLLSSPLQQIDLRKLMASDQVSVFVLSGIHVLVDQFISTNLNNLIHTLSTQTTPPSGVGDPSVRVEEDSEVARDSEAISLGDGSFSSAPHQHEDDSKDQNTLLKNQL